MKTDEDKCFEDFMNYLFREKIEPKLIRFMHESYSPELPSSYTSNYSEPSRPQTQYTSSSPITYPSDFEIRREMANWKFPLSAAKAMSVINHINYHCKTDNDIYYVFTKEALIDTLSDIINSIMVAKVSAERTGYLDVVDDYFLPIFNGIKPERLPSHDRDVLRNMGSKDPEVDLCAMLQILLSKKELLQSETQKMRSAEMLQKTTEKLQESANQIRLQPERITYTVQSGLPNKRKWGLFGAILKGASIIVPDIVSAAAPLLGTTNIDPLQTVKTGFESLSSVQLGVQTVRDGYNELRKDNNSSNLTVAA